MMPTTKKSLKRPIGIFVIPIYFMITSIVTFITAFFYNFGSDTSPSLVYRIFFYIYWLFIIIACIGVFRLKLWGRICTITFCSINILLTIGSIIMKFFFKTPLDPNALIDNPTYNASIIMGLIINPLVINYLFKPKIEDFFIEANRKKLPFRW